MTDDPFHSVVTARDVFGAVQELRGEMRTNSGELKEARKEIDELKTGQDDHETRLRSMETWRARWPIASLGAAAGGAAALAAAILQYLG
ncbi:hypothetical protein [Streptomonospora salina]|uniref:Uncharacterized protein n=1 Tax=Streptomonospora salina TaxID=104205 RepID=A0A841ELZ2_9ACTN|nr:hypothetical protein [Streptomonospora salina]MBB6001330.1 hypothetical protein [Streptomonospora salina]